MKNKQMLSDEAEKAIISSFSHNMEEIMNCFGGERYHLHKNIVSAVERAVENGVYRAAKEHFDSRGQHE